jgi:Zn-dependent protease
MELLLLLPVLLFSVVVHEVAHAWVARREGDPTADRLGRITLNPFVHLDPVGSLLVPLGLSLLPGGLIFGWARPVPVNPNNYRDRVGGDIRVSMAGIVANLGLVVLCTLAMAVVLRVGGPGGVGAGTGVAATTLGAVAEMLHYGILINLVLAIFNLIPLPPLDGSHVLVHFLPARVQLRYRELGRYGILIILGVLFFLPDAFTLIFTPVRLVHGWAMGAAGALAGLGGS